ncbi:MAG: hypothetical protein ABS46_05670 [Cytophagaceae bacterium SCN 52-12]|nr:MAG: hypothetical protein ABS46_05670 [Cytophagaceae bacterium SCN 52-12]
MSYTVAFVDDKRINRNDFERKIHMVEGLSLVFSAGSGHECMEILEGMAPGKLPQVIFMDLEMPEMDGIETIRLAKTLNPEIFFLALTVFDDDDRIFEAITAGASGYLLKHEPAHVLKEAVINVLEYGGAPMSPSIARKTLQLLSKITPPESEAQSAAIPGHITDREKEILSHLVKGWDAKKIAAHLDVSTLTVRTHIARIYHKLHINSRAQAISLAYRNKWFDR